MDELIKKLKDKNYVRAFGLMTPEEQECFREVGKKNCVNFCDYCWSNAIGAGFVSGSTYVIKPDYQPEPEFVDLEIERSGEWLGVRRTKKVDLPLAAEFLNLHCLPSMPNFEGFLCKPEETMEEKWFLQGVAKQISLGKKVFARFRKES